MSETVITCTAGFQKGDRITMSGFSDPKLNGKFVLEDVDSTHFTFRRPRWWERVWWWLKGLLQ